MINKPFLFFFVGLLVFLSACDSQKQSSETPIVYEKIYNVAWLREKLPAETLAYLRIPTFWGLFLEAKADVLHPVQKLDAHVSQIEKIKQGFVDTYSNMMPSEAQLPFKTLIKNMSTPLEVAILNATDGSMVPNGLIATTLKDTSTEQLNDLFALISQLSGSQFKVIQALDDQGQGKFMASMMPVFASFNNKSGQLALLTGITASAKQLQALLSQKQHAAELDHIFAFEDSVDVSGKNIEFWLNIAAIYKQNQGMIPASEMQIVKKMGIDKVQYFWAGTGSIQGKSQLTMRLAMPSVGFRNFIPKVNSQIDLPTAGIPRSVWQIALPSAEQIKKGFDLANSFNPKAEELKQGILEKITQIDEYLGVTLEQIYAVYGQKLVIITDDSGTWFATKILDHSAHKKILDQLSKAFEAKASVKQLAGVDINESIFSTKALENVIIGEGINVNSPLDQLQFLQHSYYQIQGDYIIQAFTPQVLADRSNAINKRPLSSWLNDKQNQNWDSAILAHSVEVKDAPRDIYHTYLNLMVMLGNFADVDVDLFALPTAQQLNLPKSGSYGFSVNSSDDAFSIQISYEYNVLENMSFMGSYFSIASLGVLMAYAIPAYRDYTVRTKIGGKLYSVASEKMMISDYYDQNKTFPNTEFLSEKFNQSDTYLYNPKNGEITLYFTQADDSSLVGKSLLLTPEVDSQGTIVWQCSSNIAIQKLPLNCK